MNGKVILFTSGRDGVGKTFLAANIGLALAEGGADVGIIEVAGGNHLHLYLGSHGNMPLFNVGEVVDLTTSELNGIERSYLDGRIVAMALEGSTIEDVNQLIDIINGFKVGKQWVILDLPPSMGEIISVVDKAFLVATPNSIELRNTKSLLETWGSSKTHIILNKMERGFRGDIRAIEEYLEAHIFSTVALSVVAVNRGFNMGKPFLLFQGKGATARDIRALASKLTKEFSPGKGAKPRFFRIKELLKVKRTSGTKDVTEQGQGSCSEQVKLRVHRQLLNEVNLEKMEQGTSFIEDGKTHGLRQTVEKKVRDILKREIGYEALTSSQGEALVTEIMDDVMGLGPIEPLLRDPEITEVMVNGPEQIFIERRGKLELTDRSFRDVGQVMHIIERIVSPIGRRVDESTPMVDARLSDGSRVNIIISPLAINGPVITIRKFSKDPFTIDDLISFGTLDKKIAEFLRMCVMTRKNIIISGGTGSGKTTLLNVISSFIPKDERIITIEDAAELQLRQEHVISLEARPANIEGKGAITIRELVRNALRMRPDRIIVGEVRGGEALDMLQAMNTGHDGSITTCHANSAADSLSRLETMVLMAGMDLPIKAIRQQIASALDLIIQVSRMGDGSRKVIQICQVIGIEGERIGLNTLFEFKLDDRLAETP